MEFTARNGLNIKIRHYDPSKSQQLIEMATESDKIVDLQGYLVVDRVFFDSFHARSQQYPEYCILYAEYYDQDTKKAVICGSVELRVKEIRL